MTKRRYEELREDRSEEQEESLRNERCGTQPQKKPEAVASVGVSAETVVEEAERGKEEAKYLYCIIPLVREESFGNLGMNNNEVYTIAFRDIAAVVCDSLMMEYELTEDNLIKHEAVLRQVMQEHTVVPVEFGTTIKRGRILRSLLARAYDPIRECLKFVDNKVELGVKAVLNEGAAASTQERAREFVSDILASLATIAEQAVTGDLFSDRLILNASFLVNRGAIDAFSEKVTELRERYPMPRLLYSGPWAPYNFVYVKIGTKGIEIARSK